MNILVSACLLGINCKYSGGNNENRKVMALADKYNLIPVCPEQLGGLETPRKPSEICGGEVKNTAGETVTKQYKNGAQAALMIAKLTGCKAAVLKERSPSCGVNSVYDGTFSKTLVSGKGITSKLLSENGIKLYSEENADELL